jgi:hypothetical protein
VLAEGAGSLSWMEVEVEELAQLMAGVEGVVVVQS